MNGGLLLTGAAGFVGRAVLASLSRRPAAPLRLLVHERAPEISRGESIESAVADLARPETLAGLCQGVETVIHLATYIGEDEERCEIVNGRGTEALVEEARSAGVMRFLYLSSAAVYGYAVHRGEKETDVTVRPATPISRSRVRAENAVLRFGGTVLRPLFVYGRGDRHFLPVILKTLERLPFLINGGRARLSVMAVDELASVLIALADVRGPQTRGEVFHVNDGQPVSLRQIAAALSEAVGSRLPSRSVPLFVARGLVRVFGRGLISGAGRRSLDHRLFLVSRDHYYDAGRLWSLLPFGPGPSLPERLPEYADWYAQYVHRPETGGRA